MAKKATKPAETMVTNGLNETRIPNNGITDTGSTGVGNVRGNGGTLRAGSGRNSSSARGTEQADQTQAIINALLNGNGTSTEDLQNTARNLYSSYYDQLRLAAQQAHDSNALALQQQQQNLGRTYDRQREESAQQYAQASSQADQRAMSRGMGRSSYNLQTLANLSQQGAQAQQDLWTRQGEDSAAIDAQLTQAQRQLQEQLQQYTRGQASDELAWIDQQRLQQQQQQNSNLQYLLNYFNTVNQQNVSNAQWERNFAEQQRQWNAQHGGSGSSSSGGGGSSGGSSSGNNTGTNTTTTGTTGNSFADWISRLTGNNSSTSSGTPRNGYYGGPQIGIYNGGSITNETTGKKYKRY